MAGVRAGRSHALHRYEAMLTLQNIIEKPDGSVVSHNHYRRVDIIDNTF